MNLDKDDRIPNDEFAKGLKEMSIDIVAYLQINFWPEVTAEWFLRDRHWPDLKTLGEIRKAKCGLVRKSIGDEKKAWRLSFSEAEGILANRQSHFQKKSYLLAKLIFTLETNGLTDGETERKLSSYFLKTVYLFTLENTSPEHFDTLEQAQNYLKLVSMMFERLSQALKIG